MAKTKQQRKKTRRRSPAAIIDLASVRALRRRELAERRVRNAMDENRGALSRLFSTGLIFTQKGARAGRDLLLAHQALLRSADLFARLLDPLSRHDAALKQRAGEFLAGRGRD